MEWARNLKLHKTETEAQALGKDSTLSTDLLNCARSQFDALGGETSTGQGAHCMHERRSNMRWQQVHVSSI